MVWVGIYYAIKVSGPLKVPNYTIGAHAYRSGIPPDHISTSVSVALPVLLV